MSFPSSSGAEPGVQPGGDSAEPSWSELVSRIRAGEPAGLTELYRIFSKGIRYYLCRQIGPQDLEDRIHEIFLAITQSIQGGELRDPDRLMGYVRTVVRRHVAAHIGEAARARRRHIGLDVGLMVSDQHPDPERSAIEHETEEVALRVLNSIPKRDREILIRFYLLEQTPAEICRDLDLTETQFRLIKSRAKARFGELGKARFSLQNGFRPEHAANF